MARERTAISEVLAERIAEAEVQYRLQRDRRYLNAESAEAAAEVEEVIEREVWTWVLARHTVEDTDG